MSADKTPAEVLAEIEEQLAAKVLEVKGADPATAQKIEDAKNDLEFFSLVQRFNAQGKKGHKYEIVDVTAHGRGFIVVVTGPKAEIHRKTINALAKDDKLTDAKVLEIVRDYVKHPALEEFDAIASELPLVPDMCIAAVQELWGARAKIRREK